MTNGGRGLGLSALGVAFALIFACGREQGGGSEAIALPGPVALKEAPVTSAVVAPPAPARSPSAIASSPLPRWDPCPALCERSRALACPNASGCVEACGEMVAVPVCLDELRLALRCFLEQPAAGWECGDDGNASVKEGACDREQERYAGCIRRVSAPN